MNILGGFFILATCCVVTMAQDNQDLKTVIMVGQHFVEVTVHVSKNELAQNPATNAVIEGINQFAPTFFREVAASNPGNVIISSPSAFIALSMFAYGSSGKTEEEFNRVLQLPEKSVGKIGYANFIDSINTAKGVKLQLANKIFINDMYAIGQMYHDLVQTTFRSDFQYLSFANVQEAVSLINKWVTENTNNRINDFFMPYSFSHGTNMVLVDVIYFKASWKKPFENLESGNKPFHVTARKSVEVPFVYKRGLYRYGVISELNAKLVEIPYESEDFSMVIILPSTIDGLTEVEEKLAQRDFTELVKTINETDVNVFIPKFKIESTLDLIPSLKKMGLNRAFNKYVAQFSEIFDTGVYIDNFIQKAFIEVNEEGTEAGTGYSSPVGSGIVPHVPENFYVDRPFHLSILKKDKSNNKRFELFAARVFDPSL